MTKKFTFLKKIASVKSALVKSGLILTAPLLLTLQACSTNPVTGRQEFTPFLPQSAEKDIGAREHVKILAEFGGEYKNAKIKNYVAKVSQRITKVTENPADSYTVTVLNSPIVNAFALPGGYLYATRGLLALANSEAQLAGVIGHEAGHVTARHAAGRSNRQVLAGLGALVIGSLTGSQLISQVADMGAQGYLAHYSRSNEYEADELGVRYLARAGYSPYAQGQFLHALGKYSHFSAKEAGREAPAPNWLDSHPSTPERVTKAYGLAAQAATQTPKADYDGTSAHLRAINGMIYGDNPDEGVIRGRNFTHPIMKFTFRVPTGYKLTNKPTAVYARDERTGAIIQFDVQKVAAGVTPEAHLQNDFMKGARLSGLKRFNINGMNAATAWTVVQAGRTATPARLVVLKYGKNFIARFLMIAPENIFKSENKKFEQVALSFRKLAANEVKKYKPYRIRLYKVKSRDTARSVARKSPLKDFALERFLVLNGLKSERDLKKGMTVKTIAY